MEFGYTIPLQKHVGKRILEYGTERERLFCWDVHAIRLRGQDAALAVNCKNRYTVVLLGMEREWNALHGVLLRGLRSAFSADGFSDEWAVRYFARAGEASVTRTHGRREVAFLNRAWEDALACDMAAIPDSRDQFPLNRAVNSIPCRCAGHEGTGAALERMREDLVAL